jgi:alkanesulfonate monooxygenase SsuD/methylene tetrahydromethanopterin reductase-like flavin-dependent oxidoreductase (luciferase family)
VHDAKVPVLIGGTTDAAIRRTVTWGAGWTIGGAGPQQAGQFYARVRAAWADAGRTGEPRLAALAYFSLGADAEDESRNYLLHYYGFLGLWAERISDSALRSESVIRDTVKAFEDVGCTELYLDPTCARLDQVDRLADAVL